MAEEPKRQQADEVDLGQILSLIHSFFKGIGNYLLQFYTSLFRNARALFILIVAGVCLGFGWNLTRGPQFVQEFIVRPNVDSESYLVDKVLEIDLKLKSKDSGFISALRIDPNDLEILGVELQPMGVKPSKALLEDEMKYFTILQDFKEEGYIKDIIKAELTRQRSLNQRLVFRVKSNSDVTKEQTSRVLEHINAIEFYSKLLEVHNENARKRIETNEKLISQIDQIIENYSKQLLKDKPFESSQIVLGQEEKLNITGLLTLKNEVISNTESKIIELERRDAPITIMHRGEIKRRKIPIYLEGYILGPCILITVYLIFYGVKRLNRQVTLIK